MKAGSFTERALLRAIADLRSIEQAKAADALRLRELAQEARSRLEKHMLILAAEESLP
jgi:hypothetical protein